MTTKTIKKTVKKKATKTVAKKVSTITMTVNQANNILAFAAKNGKTIKFLENKVNALNA